MKAQAGLRKCWRSVLHSKHWISERMQSHLKLNKDSKPPGEGGRACNQFGHQKPGWPEACFSGIISWNFGMTRKTSTTTVRFMTVTGDTWDTERDKFTRTRALPRHLSPLGTVTSSLQGDPANIGNDPGPPVWGSAWGPEPSRERVGDWGGPETVWALLCFAARRATRPNGELGYSTRRHMLGCERPEAGSSARGVVLTELQSSI